jgi:hypothetical protein
MKKNTFAMTLAIGFLILIVSMPFSSAAEEDVDVKVIDLKVGDSFTYTPYVVDGAYIDAYGEGVIGSVATRNGAFLSWEPNGDTLSGTAVSVGTYNVTLMATWTENGQIIQAYQVMLFVVAENDGRSISINYKSGDTSMDGWTQTVEIETHSSTDSSGRSLTLVDVLCIGMVGVCATIHIIRRDPLSLIFTVAFTVLTVCDLFGVIL